MKLSGRIASLAIVAVAVQACGSDPAGPGNAAAADGLLDPLGDATLDIDEADADTAGDGQTLPDVAFAPQTCSEPKECTTSVCAQSANGKVCAISCVENCPDGYVCSLVQPAGADAYNVCLPRFVRLCQPCVENKDCNEPGASGNVCLDQGGAGSFCGERCNPASPICPSGYSCKPGSDAQSGQCQPDGGECSCSAFATEIKASTLCLTKTAFGKCAGKRTCTPSGLSECQGPEATAESCNGKDDDCDGVTDDSVPLGEPCDNANEFGVCKGTVTGCAEGKSVCSSKVPAKEACNGVDDDCDGATDENLCIDDGNACTEEVCDPNGPCQHVPLTGPGCNDGNVCTSVDKCVEGKCVGASPVPCDDGNPCTGEACDLFAGCTYAPAKDGTDCDDQDVCTVTSKCLGGVCKSGATKTCDDENPCTSDSCDSIDGCANLAVDATCTGDAPCSSYACVKGQCIGKALSGQDCDDNDACTEVAKCVDGACIGGKAKDCDDGNACTTDSCSAIGGCTNLATSGTCTDDGNSCTADVCQSGKCGHPLLVDGVACTADGEPCTTDACSGGVCAHLATTGGPCDDGNLCTQADKCVTGKCTGSGTPMCNDFNGCTADACDPLQGCVHVPLGQDTKCEEDGNPCTLDVCTAGDCKHPGGNDNAPCLDDGNSCTADVCGSGNCKHAAGTDTPCNDGDACTTSDACQVGTCKGSTPVDCEDANPCTVDGCDKVLGCTHKAAADDTACGDDGDACSADVCQAGVCKHPFSAATCQKWDQAVWDTSTWAP